MWILQEHLQKQGHLSIEARVCVLNNADQKYLNKHQRFDKANVHHMGSIDHMYEIKIYIFDSELFFYLSDN